MTTMDEFFWPNGERPGWALRWSVSNIEAHVEVCTATSSQRDGEWVEDIVLSDGGSGITELDGPWIHEFSVIIRFDGYASMWAEELQLGPDNGIADLVPLFDYLYRRAEELFAAQPR